MTGCVASKPRLFASGITCSELLTTPAEASQRLTQRIPKNTQLPSQQIIYYILLYKDSRHRVSSQRVVITDKEVSVSREHIFDLTVSHLLGDEFVFVRSPAKKVEIAIENSRL